MVFAAFVTIASAGVVASGAYPAQIAYSAATDVSYSSLSAPAGYAAVPAHPYSAPTFAEVPAPVAYANSANYDYGYSVNDGLTGDSKTHQETRNGDAVQGSYSLIEADGTKRIVQYTADAYNGFNAVVHKEPASVAVKSVVPAPVAYTAPAYKVATPASYPAPAPVAYTAPVSYRSLANLAGPSRALSFASRFPSLYRH